ncbi:hypothetical protein [Streptomyces fulvorobeus]|uniref:Uncharacterized protein n=1 Tax=Streptomyces fulvorobeus TaxID=284028 RepID=A0A7J0C5A6_9ACTN|nr:hypothetical protein [Streptomyces fulvorobeus]NYE41303.1 hypothetical protein [Streptomyces fulvorobeus]GFM97649.1 hypothetical protein Sfulv_24600 [Streptomyces fulvorobeus]
MGIADQFKDKAQELADQAKRKKMADEKGGAARERSSDEPERGAERSGLRDRSQDMTDDARERFDR